MTNRFVAISALSLALGGVAACSSPPPPEAQGPLFPGSARMTVAHHTASTDDVVCTNVSELMLIKADGSTFDVSVDRTAGLVAKAVNIRDFGGFNGSYQDRLQGSAEVSKNGNTLTITGAAVGFYADKPAVRVTRDFTLNVVC